MLTEAQKIEMILDALAKTDATFIRNGTEYAGPDAANHLRGKLGRAGDKVKTARQFIDKLATASSASGKPYQVKPKGGEAMESKAWFDALLKKIEAGEIKPPASAERTPFVAPNLAVTVDATEAQDLKEWGDKAAAICKAQYGMICRTLRSEGFNPPQAVMIVFKKEFGPPAATSGGVISVSVDWVRKHPEDLGMMVHELTHVVQSYGKIRPNTGWITEGIADYIRWHVFEPGMDKSKIDVKKATYHDGYRTTARFLAFVNNTYDKEFVTKLNAAMRNGEADETSFKALIGKDVSDLWSEFVGTLDGVPAGGK